MRIQKTTVASISSSTLPVLFFLRLESSPSHLPRHEGMNRNYSHHTVASGVFFRHVGALYPMQIISPMIYTMDLVDRSKNTSDTRLLRAYTAHLIVHGQRDFVKVAASLNDLACTSVAPIDRPCTVTKEDLDSSSSSR